MDIAFFYRCVHKNAKPPRKATNGSWGFDVCALTDVVVKPGEVKLIPTGLVVKKSFRHSMIAVVPRSSLGIKKGLIFPHSIGIIDDDYCSDSDELKVPVMNITKNDVHIMKGERIAQIIPFKIVTGEAIEWARPFSDTKRGGFGSTGAT